MDKIIIKDLELYCRHGVFPEERKLGQRFLVSAYLETDTRRAGLSDDLHESIDYGKVCMKIRDFLENNTYQLIEAAAEHLARELLLGFPLLQGVRLELKKPWAPIGLPLQTVSVEIERSWHDVYVSFGSNMGDRKGFLDFALEQLKENPDFKVIKVSDYIETAPYGVTDQDPFLNGAIHLKTLFTPHETLDEFHRIEKEAGRVRKVHWGPRTLDLDIIFYDDLILGDDDLIIPHKDMANRLFVLTPLCQIAPMLRHPVTGKTMEQMEEDLK